MQLSARFAAALIALSLSTSSVALAQDGKVAKAQKMLNKYGGSDTVALAKAWDAIQDAKGHAKTRDKASTWVILGDVARAYALDDNATSPAKDPVETAITAYATAAEKDGASDLSESIIEGVAGLESAGRTRGAQAYESADYDAAWAHFQQVLAAQAVIRQVGRIDEAAEASTLQLAILTAVKRNDADNAKILHADLNSAYKAPTATSLAVAELLADTGPEDAVAFLEPLSDKNPDDADLMAARFEHLFALDRSADVVKLLETHAGSQGKALGITLLHARTFERLTDLDSAAAVYAKAFEIGPTDQDVLRGYADVEMRRARTFDLAAGKSRRWKDKKANRAKRDASRETAIELLRASRKGEPDHLPTLELLREVYEDVGLPDKEEIEALEQAIQKLQEEATNEP